MWPQCNATPPTSCTSQRPLPSPKLRTLDSTTGWTPPWDRRGRVGPPGRSYRAILVTRRRVGVPAVERDPLTLWRWLRLCDRAGHGLRRRNSGRAEAVELAQVQGYAVWLAGRQLVRDQWSVAEVL